MNDVFSPPWSYQNKSHVSLNESCWSYIYLSSHSFWVLGEIKIHSNWLPCVATAPDALSNIHKDLKGVPVDPICLLYIYISLQSSGKLSNKVTFAARYYWLFLPCKFLYSHAVYCEWQMEQDEEMFMNIIDQVLRVLH